MRILHLIFRLHKAWPLRAEIGEKSGFFDGKASFLEQEKQVYQPFFALLERNIQKNSRLKLSLIVSGPWLEQAEQFAPELVERLCDLVSTDQIEVLVEPYYHSLAFFYDKVEMADQVRLAQDRAMDLLGAESEILVCPELIYNDKTARWAEEFGFVATVAAGTGVDWRSDNHVYEATGCRYLRVLVPNRELSSKIAMADPDLLVEKIDKETEERQEVLSLAKFQKLVDLSGLRGNLINLYFEAEIVREQKDAGIIGFFDELFQNWLKTSGNQFMHAAEACRVERPTAEISVRETVSWPMVRDDVSENNMPEKGLLPALYYQVPEPWKDAAQIRLEKALYAVRDRVVESGDVSLLSDFGRLTALGYLNSKFDRKHLETSIEVLKERAEVILKTPKVVERPEEIKVSRIVKPKVEPVKVDIAEDLAKNDDGLAAKASLDEMVAQLDANGAPQDNTAEAGVEELEVLVKREMKKNDDLGQKGVSRGTKSKDGKKRRRFRLVIE